MTIDSPTAAASPTRGFKRAHLILGRVWRVFFGLVLCQTPVTAVLVLGWSYRLLQRQAVRRWYGRCDGSVGSDDFAETVARNPRLAGFAQWPRWIMAQTPRNQVPGTASRTKRIVRFMADVFHHASGSLWTNLKIGFKALCTLWLVTLPSGLLWLFSWWSGWENSFNKGYEQAWVGPSVGIAGILAFVVVMPVVPMAVARQAVVGDWRAFFDVRLHVQLMRRNSAHYLALNVLIALLSLPVAVFAAMPVAFPSWISGYAELGRPQAMQAAEPFYLLASLYLLLALIGVRMFAARVYADAMLGCVQAGAVAIARLGELERTALSHFQLLPMQPAAGVTAGGVPKRLISSILRFASLAAVPLVWVLIAVMLYISQFFHYDWVHWINQPLIQLPWFHRP